MNATFFFVGDDEEAACLNGSEGKSRWSTILLKHLVVMHARTIYISMKKGSAKKTNGLNINEDDHCKFYLSNTQVCGSSSSVDGGGTLCENWNATF